MSSVPGLAYTDYKASVDVFPIMGESPSGEYVLFFPVPEANRRPVDPETPNG